MGQNASKHGHVALAHAENQIVIRRYNGVPYVSLLSRSADQELVFHPVEVDSECELVEPMLDEHGEISFPVYLHHFGDLKNVNLCSKSIRSLSSNIAVLTRIRRLYVCCNALLHVPMEIASLKMLRVLSLERNFLDDIPSAIWELACLEELKLSHNRIRELSEDVGRLCKLRILGMANNKLVNLPRSIEKLKLLETLDISFNPQITLLPAEIATLPRVRLYTDGIEFSKIMAESLTLKARVPTLKSLSAVVLLRVDMPDNLYMPERVRQYLETRNKCTVCQTAFFGDPICVKKWWSQNDGKPVPVMFNLCRLHTNLKFFVPATKLISSSGFKRHLERMLGIQ